MSGEPANHVTQARSMGILGGTFDPVHLGHLRSAYELMVTLSLDEVRFIPCGIPPHRESPVAPVSIRQAMVEAAIEPCRRFHLDHRELETNSPSYTVTTLLSLRSEFPSIPLCLFLGMDAFENLPGWHRWQELIDLAHIVVAHRPGWSAPQEGALGDLLANRLTDQAGKLQEEPAGCLFIHAVTQLEISSTVIRTLVSDGGDPRFLVPPGVQTIIEKSGCYLRNPRKSEQN